IAEGRPLSADFPDALSEPQEVETPGQRTIDDLSQFLGVDPRATTKAMPVVADGRVVLALVRGDDRLNEMKLLQALGEDFRPAEQEEIRQAFGAAGGSIGPVGASVEVIADETLPGGQYVVGGHRADGGSTWPPSIAPYDVHVVTLSGVEEQADEAARVLDEAGAVVLLDDRDQRAGEKFADADLLGCPLRMTVGKKTTEDGAVDVRERSTGEE